MRLFGQGLMLAIGFGSITAGMIASLIGYSNMYLLMSFLLFVGVIIYYLCFSRQKS